MHFSDNRYSAFPAKLFKNSGNCIKDKSIIEKLYFVSVCKDEETKTVEWYLKPENKVALETKLAECKNNPGELWNTPNCVNARMAFEKRFLGGKFEKVKEPAIPKF